VETGVGVSAITSVESSAVVRIGVVVSGTSGMSETVVGVLVFGIKCQLKILIAGVCG
jgi:hypothetical protein